MKMSKVFLGGTCNGSTWREALIALLPPSVFYFNPVVEDWTPECRVREEDEKASSNLHLYVLTPKQTGCYAFAEIMDSVHDEDVITLVCGLDGDDAFGFGEGQLRSLLALQEMLLRHADTVVLFRSLELLAKWLNMEAEGYEASAELRMDPCFGELVDVPPAAGEPGDAS